MPFPFHSPTTGRAPVMPTPNAPILSSGSPSQTQLLFASRYHVPSINTPIFVDPSPFQSPTTGIAPVRPIPNTPKVSEGVPSQAQDWLESRYHVPWSKMPILKGWTAIATVQVRLEGLGSGLPALSTA